MDVIDHRPRTWIDGSPIYRFCYIGEKTFSSKTEGFICNLPSAINVLVGCTVNMKQGVYILDVSRATWQNIGAAFGLYIEHANKRVVISVGDLSWTGFSQPIVMVVLEYTKA